MMKKNLLIGLLSVFSFYVSIAQPTHVYTDKELKFKQAVDYFDAGQYMLAYPLLKELYAELPESGKSAHTYLNDDVGFYFIVSQLSMMMSAGEIMADDYISTVNNEPRKHQMCFYLAHYYYLSQDYPKAIEYYNQTRFENLTNEQIGDAKFEKAYSLFNEKEFAKALPLFNEIHQLPENKYYVPANYYYGFISFINKDYSNALDAFRLIETNPEYNAVVPYYVAEIYYSRNLKKEALQYSDSVLTAKGGSYYKKQLQLLTAQLYFENQDYKKALPLFEDYVNSSDKVSKDVMYELSYCHYKNNNIKQAIDGFKQLSSEKDSMVQNSMYLLGELYLKKGDKPNARTAFRYSAYNSSNAEQQRISRFNYAKLSYELDYQDIALAEIKRYIKDYPGSEYDNEARELMVSMLANTNNFDEGLSVYRSLSKSSEAAKKVYARLLYGKSIQLINEQRIAEADDLLSEILTNTSAGNVALFAKFWKGEIAYRRQQYSDAQRFLTEYIDSKAPWQGEANTTNANYTLGYVYFQQEQYKNALVCFEKIMVNVKSGATTLQQDVYLRVADCYYAQKDFVKAATMYDIIFSNNFQQADYALYQKAMIAGVKSGSDKIKLLNSLLKMYPSSPLALDCQMEIASTYMADEKFADAVPYLNTVINTSDASGLKPKAISKLGLAYYNSNDNKNALTAYRQLIKTYPQSEETSEALVTIRDIFIEEGQPDGYLALMKENGIVVAVNEADSLSFIAPYNKYEAGDCMASIPGFGTYINGYPNGAYVIDANYYRALCYQKMKEFNQAIQGFDYVNSRGVSKYFEDATLQLARIYYLEMKDYANAKKYFESLRTNAVNPEMQLEALRGMVRVYYQLKDYSTASDAARELADKKGVSTDDKSIAALVLGKAQQVAGDTAKAIESFKVVVPLSKSAWGAEARYELAAAYCNQNNLTLAEKYAMSVIRETGSYDNWVTKSYILLGDIFMKQKDYFNAKATYESVAGNASIEELKAEARRKLEIAKAEEKKSSKISN